MSVQLMTSWAEHDHALHGVLSKLSRSLCIFDEDLMQLKLERKENADLLQRFLVADMSNRIQIVVKNAQPLQTKCARLMGLYMQYPHAMSVIEAPAHLARLNNLMLIADDAQALIRFHQDHARSKAIIDDPVECRPYIQRFKDILLEGGGVVTARPLGL